MWNIHHPYIIIENGFESLSCRLQLVTIKMTSIRESFNTEQEDRRLMENNFLDEIDLWDVIQYADASAFEYIYANRKKYALHIQ